MGPPIEKEGLFKSVARFAKKPFEFLKKPNPHDAEARKQHDLLKAMEAAGADMGASHGKDYDDFEENPPHQMDEAKYGRIFENLERDQKAMRGEGDPEEEYRASGVPFAEQSALASFGGIFRLLLIVAVIFLVLGLFGIL